MRTEASFYFIIEIFLLVIEKLLSLLRKNCFQYANISCTSGFISSARIIITYICK